MDTKSIFFFYPACFLWENTINLALQNICKQHQYTYKPLRYSNGYQNLLRDVSIDEQCKLAFFEHNPNFNNADFKIVKEKLPNAKIIMFGSDTIYYGGPQAICWPIDLLIDTIKRMVNECERCPAEHYYWNISESIIEQISKCKLSDIKNKRLISLCRDASGERVSFFNRLHDCGYPVSWNLKLYNHADIYYAYSQHEFVLGHTTPVFSSRDRTMKGWRDWLAPFCYTVLIYDDYPDILDIGQDIVPTYTYLDQNSVVNLVKKIYDNPTLYNTYLLKQRDWALNNTLEKQLTRILIKHKMLEE